MSTIKVKLKRSLTGKKPEHRQNVNALGLRTIGQIVEHEDTPSIRGMLEKSGFLLEVMEKE